MWVQDDLQLEWVGEACNGTQAVDAVARLKPDIVLLDVQMPGLSGFDVISRLPRDELPAVVFVTAYDDYALQAFEVHALDYLLKPVAEARFREAIDRFKRQIFIADIALAL